MRIYTRGGDRGETSLLGGRRVRKDDLRIELCGVLDELNAWLGIAAASGLQEAEILEVLRGLQSEVFDLGAEVAASGPDSRAAGRVRRRTAADVERLEGLIDRVEAELTPLESFILPGGHPAAAALHGARATARTAERRAVSLAAADPSLNPEVLRYLNRLSDLLFVLARLVNHRAGVPDVPWRPQDS